MNRGNIKLAIDRCIAHDVPDAADMIESLCQQLARCIDTCATRENEIIEAEQQLAAALAACRLKDELITDACTAIAFYGEQPPQELFDALSMPCDDSTLRAYIGEPVLWRSKRGLITSDQILPDDEPLYSPKGLK